MRKILFFLLLVLNLEASNRFTSYLFSDDYTTVRQGINLGGDLNARWRGMTPIYNACRGGWGDIVELMIRRGADVNAQSYGETPLLKATGRKVNDVNLAKILLANGAKVNAQDSQGNTPLYHAILNRNAKMIKLLLDYKADMYIKNKRGDTPARYILSSKTMPSLNFDEKDLMVSTQPFLLSRNMVPIGVVNKTNQFMKITQIAVYLNGSLVGEVQVNKGLPPNSKIPNIASVKLSQKVYQLIKLNSNGQTKVDYGLALEYNLDGASKSFTKTDQVYLELW